MVASRFLIAAFVAAVSATSLVVRDDAYFASFLKRQEPGTPAYNCHDNCGSAITLSRTANPCSNAAFVADYNNCLKCSGPDNYNIWRYYGGTLSTAGAGCGFDTEPLSGKQEDVPEAGGTGAASSAAPAQTSAAAPASSQAAATTEAATSKAPVSSVASSSVATSSALPTTVDTSVVSSAPTYPTVIANGTLSSSVSGVPSPSTNTSASSTVSTPTEVTNNAAAGLRVGDAAGVFGAIFVGALLGM